MKLGGIKSRPDDRDYLYTPRRAGLLGLAPPRQIDRSGEEANYLRAGVTTDPQLYGLELRYKFGAFH